MTHINNELNNVARELERHKADFDRMAKGAPATAQRYLGELADATQGAILACYVRMNLSLGAGVTHVHMGLGEITNVSADRKHVTVRWQRADGEQPLRTHHITELHYL